MSNWQLPPEGGHMERPDGVYYQTMNMTEINARLKKNDLIIIPVGSTECHDAAQPLGEDTFLVSRMAEQVALKTGGTVAEPVWYGSHPYNHRECPALSSFLKMRSWPICAPSSRGSGTRAFASKSCSTATARRKLSPWLCTSGPRKYQVPCILISLHWPTVIHDYLKDKAHGGPFETPFQHACEVEASYSLALFPEFMHMELAVDTKPEGFLPPGHVDKGGEVYHAPIKGHEHVGLGGAEVLGVSRRRDRAAHPGQCRESQAWS